MPRKKIAPSQKERALLRKIWLHIDFIIIKQILFGITNSINEKALKEFDKTILKIDPEIGKTGPNSYWPADYSLSSIFFKRLDGFLQEVEKSQSPALRTVNWRAKELRRLLKNLSSLFPTAK